MVRSCMFIINLIAIFFFYSNLQCKDIITIEIDGSNLPNANGSIEVGEKIYKKNCSECHGYSGEGLTAPELVGKSDLTGDRISKSIGNFWPYAPKIFDYINRAKRNSNNDYFSDSEVYSLTAYLLNINDLYDRKIINKEYLSGVQMPNRNGFINLSN